MQSIRDFLQKRLKLTNIPNALDPALRRPGRFDREIAISIPDQNARLEILQIHTRGMPLAADVDLESIAQLTHGFVGADLEALCKEAAMLALRQALPQLESKAEMTPLALISDLQVKQDHFLQASTEIEPTAIREVFVEVRHVSWEEVSGLEEVKQELREAVEWPLHYTELLERADARPPKGILLVGPQVPGKRCWLGPSLLPAAPTLFLSKGRS